MSMKQTGTFLLTSSPRKELWIFLSLTQHVLAAIDYFQGKNSVKRLDDVQRNREDNWERAARAEEECVYIPAGMSDYAFVYGHEPWETFSDYW